MSGRLFFRQVTDLFETTVICFGITTSPSNPPAMMNEDFTDLIWNELVCGVVLDDILITKTMRSTITLHVLFLSDSNTSSCLQHDKCAFKHTQLKYLLTLLHTYRRNGSEASRRVRKWPVPKTKKECSHSFGSNSSPVYLKVLASCMTTV